MAENLHYDLFVGLRATKLRRISIDRLRIVFADSCPQFAQSVDRMTILSDLLAKLKTEQLIDLPKQSSSWIQTSQPALPKWIKLKKLDDDRRSYSEVAWTPELSFCTELKNKSQLDAALRINEFLIRRRHELQMVPFRERSLEIFGDEKRLDSMVRAGCLFSGRLPLSVIGAFEAPFPLPFEVAIVKRKPILIIENHHTYWSFCEWNKEFREFSAIVYGGGNSLARGRLALKKIMDAVESDSVRYFGDIDVAGFEIPCEFNAHAVAQTDLTVRPATALYALLLEFGLRRHSEEQPSSRQKMAIQHWFGFSSVGEKLVNLLSDSHWIPQESLGYEKLLELAALGVSTSNE